MRILLCLTVSVTALLAAGVPRNIDSPPDTSEAAREIIAAAARATGSSDYGDLLQLATDATVVGKGGSSTRRQGASPTWEPESSPAVGRQSCPTPPRAGSPQRPGHTVPWSSAVTVPMPR